MGQRWGAARQGGGLLPGPGKQRACNIEVFAVGKRICNHTACVGRASSGALIACCLLGFLAVQLQKVGILLEFGAANNLTADEVIVSAACSCAVCCRLHLLAALREAGPRKVGF